MRSVSTLPALDTCDIDHVHPEGVRRARAALPHADAASDLAALFGALGDPTRVRLLAALAAGPLCVCDLAAVLGMTQSAVSHQLRLLRALGLVRARREGKLVWYALDDEHVRALLAVGADHIGHRFPVRKENETEQSA
ncbi:MAG: metalloregulator ArsR/SmtB family transcription factor [Thermomicrobia bacterium]|nr:metalloregulator ArsR/SmtB family transcription factor [Thermomicrobia bacterium]MCA1724626.1 metalloregulator ArsR/SmtB family transcription factor [Thermomicrobia bacterium]